MRHRKKGYKLGRTHAHRKATLAALSTALIEHKRITTTVTKAKALRMYVEPLINRAKSDTTHNRREVFRHLQSKAAVKELFGDVAAQVGDRPGGYTRVIKLGQRSGDGAEMAVIELVDFNDVKPEGSASGSSRRTRRGGGRGRRKKSAAPAAEATETQQVTETAEEQEPTPQGRADDAEATADEAPEAQAEETADTDESPEADEEKKEG